MERMKIDSPSRQQNEAILSEVILTLDRLYLCEWDDDTWMEIFIASQQGVNDV
jgi:hypothetical protein